MGRPKKTAKYSLGNIETVQNENSSTLTKEQILAKFERFIRYDKRFSDYNVRNSVDRLRHILYKYDMTVPTKEAVQAMEDELKSRGIKNSTIKQYIYTLKTLAECLKIELDITPPKVTKAKIDYLSIPEIRAMFAACDNLRDLTILHVLFFTGVRNSECIRIRIQDVDVKNLALYIRDRGEGIKNYQEKKCALTDDAARMLKKYLEYRQSLDLTHDYLFFTVDGEPFAGRERLNRMVKNVAKKAGINRPVTCHRIRHSAAMAMLRSGIPLTSVSRQLGHTSCATTTEFYLHASYDEDLKEDIKKFVI